ncbi:hypothetical protein GCM10027432_20760 [Lysobacter fragariae]
MDWTRLLGRHSLADIPGPASLTGKFPDGYANAAPCFNAPFPASAGGYAHSASWIRVGNGTNYKPEL